MIKSFIRSCLPNPFDKLLKRITRENKSRFLIVWNRGLGDIPLGLYALTYRIRSFVPHASITFLTRPDLKDAFSMLENIKILSIPSMQRGKAIDINGALKGHHLSSNMFDVILESPDPTRWVNWQLGKLTPKLKWDEKWDKLSLSFNLKKDETYIGAHVQTETGMYYGYEKNWELSSWRDCFKRIGKEKKGKILLFGMKKDPAFLMDNIIDLRGETSLFQMLSLLKNQCQYLIAPDSGILSLIYYVDTNFPIKVVSLWADPNQGVLKQKCLSPNQQFKHVPLIGKNHAIANIHVETVYTALFG